MPPVQVRVSSRTCGSRRGGIMPGRAGRAHRRDHLPEQLTTQLRLIPVTGQARRLRRADIPRGGLHVHARLAAGRLPAQPSQARRTSLTCVTKSPGTPPLPSLSVRNESRGYIRLVHQLNQMVPPPVATTLTRWSHAHGRRHCSAGRTARQRRRNGDGDPVPPRLADVLHRPPAAWSGSCGWRRPGRSGPCARWELGLRPEVISLRLLCCSSRVAYRTLPGS